MEPKSRQLMSASTIVGVALFGILCLGQPQSSFGQSNWSDVSRWLVELESREVRIDGTEDPTLGRNVCRVIGGDRKQGVLYQFIGHEELITQPDSKSVVGTDWRFEPFNIKLQLKNELWSAYEPFNRMLEMSHLKKGSEVPSPLSNDQLFSFFPVWPVDDYAPPRMQGGKLALTLDEITSGNLYQQTQTDEMKNGERCQVWLAKNGLERVWISVDRPDCLVQRDRYLKTDGRTIWKLKVDEVKQFGQLWLPAKLTYFLFQDAEHPETITGRGITEVTRFVTNEQVEHDAFELKMSPGTLQRGGEGQNLKLLQISKGGRQEHFEQLSKFYRDSIGLPRNSSSSKVNWYRLLIAAGIGAAIGCFFWMPSGKQKKSPPKSS